MSVREELCNCIIDKCERDDNWYYHGFHMDLDEGLNDFISMLKDGIICQLLSGKREGGINGLFYVSLSKILNCSNSSYLKITSSMPAFIIEGIRAIKTNEKYRYGIYDDEYHKLFKVKPENIIGLQFPLHEIIDCIDTKDKYIYNLADILDYLVITESSLPFYGFDNPVGDLYLIDKGKCRDLINSSFSCR